MVIPCNIDVKWIFMKFVILGKGESNFKGKIFFSLSFSPLINPTFLSYSLRFGFDSIFHLVWRETLEGRKKGPETPGVGDTLQPSTETQ